MESSLEKEGEEKTKENGKKQVERVVGKLRD